MGEDTRHMDLIGISLFALVLLTITLAAWKVLDLAMWAMDSLFTR